MCARFRSVSLTTALCFLLASVPYLLYAAVYAVLRPSESPATKRAVEPTVSVVLPTYNEARIVRAKLDDIVSLAYPMERVEVVVVDSSDDRTREVVREFFADRDAPALTLIEEDERSGVATAVNTAVAHATGDVVFRTDVDSKLAADALSETVANLADPAVGVVTGRQAEVLGDSAVESDYRDLLSVVQAVESHLDSTFIVHGPCVGFRREAYVPIPADTIADDTELAVRIRRQGKRVVMDPAVRFVESGTSRFRGRRRRKDRRAMGLLQVLVRHRDALWRYGLYGCFVLPANWLFMFVSPWLLLAGGALFGVGAVALLGPFGAVVPLGGLCVAWLGQRDSLGPLQAPYAVVDSQVSLLVGCLRLFGEETDGTWELDRESRRHFEEGT